jgi:hypothetical protein
MTLSVAWVRDVGTHPEMIFASDSRLTQGGTWDAGPKIMRLGRSDALVSFAGATLLAYPFMIHAANAVHAFRPWRERQRDLRQVPRRMLDVMNAMIELGDTFREGYNEPLTELMLGGWSWEAQDFLLWRLHWKQTEGAFRHETIPQKYVGKCCFIGDRSEEDEDLDVVPFARRRLRARLEEKGKLGQPLNMEPFEVLVEIIREERFRTVGGSPQLAKVYRHMNTQFFAVQWPAADGKLTYGGRELLEYEEFGLPELDPDRPEIHARTTRDALMSRRRAQITEVLLGVIEGAGRMTVDELLEWAQGQEIDASEEGIRDILERAVANGDLAQPEDGLVAWPAEKETPEAEEPEP